MNQKGKKGEVQQKFYDDNLHLPYAMGVNALNVAKNKIQTFGLDRFTQEPITLKSNFEKVKNFDSDAYFKNSIGITSANSKAQKIVLSFNPSQGNYVKTQALHSSQKILIDNNKELKIELKLNITPELIMTLLSFGKDCTVLKPERLKQELISKLNLALQNYSE